MYPSQKRDRPQVPYHEAWFWMGFLVLMAGLFTHSNTLKMLAAFILIVGPTAWLWNKFALHRLNYTRTFSVERAFVGETVELTITLANRKWLPLLWVKIEDEFPEEVPPVEGELPPSSQQNRKLFTRITAMGRHQQAQWKLTLACQKRGFYFFGPVTISSGDLFGFFTTTRTYTHHDRLIVYPRIHTLTELGLPTKDPFGHRKAHQRLFEDPTRTVGVREYTHSDPLKRVHWKMTARLQELQVRIWEPSESSQVVFFLNVATFARFWEGIIPDLLEETISVAASLALAISQQKRPVGLFANASIPRSDQPIKVPPGRSMYQMRRILEALAAITPYPRISIEELLLRESPRLNWGATLVVVTGIVTPELVQTMLQLRHARRHLALVSLDPRWSGDPNLEAAGIVVHQIPYQR
ncbi:hypothetical protein ARMA_0974 [Ardenticatena maritima]|uniref:DUF58 domain-containing protein n=1 Tax=Ardenticatena maritima TaxID=872965 RepID=A0A0M8K7S3_9CHLR|nr:DUF58 domain-containing protein [Ardenticatena maritima]GAP62551.1 hypothetical protein ARMA_0974 [Ardenticatena maritima]